MHEINVWTFPTGKSKTAIQKEVTRYAMRNGDYPQDCPIRFYDTVLKNRAEAERWIELNDAGWYDNISIRYRDGRKIMRLVKFEYHC